MRLLLIEDDELLGGGLCDFLRADGHAVEWARRLGDIEAYRGEPFDAYLLDWQLPDGSGLEWLKARRKGGDATPVLMLTARDLLEDRLRGLDSGADDYIVKPFAPEEMAARVRAICRRSAGSAGALIRVGDVEVDLVARCAWLGDERIELHVARVVGARGAGAAARPHRHQGRAGALVLGFESELSSNAIEVHVSSLRKKLGPELQSRPCAAWATGSVSRHEVVALALALAFDRRPARALARAVVGAVVRRARRGGVGDRARGGRGAPRRHAAERGRRADRPAGAEPDRARHPSTLPHAPKTSGRFTWQLVSHQGGRPTSCRVHLSLLRSCRCTTPRSPGSRTSLGGASTARRPVTTGMVDVAQTTDERVEAGTEIALAALFAGAPMTVLAVLWLRSRIRRELQPLRELSQRLAHYDPMQPGATLGAAEREELRPVRTPPSMPSPAG